MKAGQVNSVLTRKTEDYMEKGNIEKSLQISVLKSKLQAEILKSEIELFENLQNIINIEFSYLTTSTLNKYVKQEREDAIREVYNIVMNMWINVK